MTLAILTFHRAFNCGAMLQAWALKSVLNELGHFVVFPSCNTIGECAKGRTFPSFKGLHWWHGVARLIRWLLKWPSFFWNEGLYRRLKWSRFTTFRSRWLDEECNSPASFCERYDAVIIGSDQVWNPDIVGKMQTLFLGEWASPGFPLIGYAVSVGDESEKILKDSRFVLAVSRFSALSFRENIEKISSLLIPSPYTCVCDPTLLLSRDYYRKCECPRRLHRRPYLLIYTLWFATEMWPMASRIAQRLGLDLVLIDPARESRHERKALPNIWAVSPDRFLAYVRDATCIMAASFHGAVFSLIYNKPFVCYQTRAEMLSSRVGQLLMRIGEHNRIFNQESSVAEVEACLLKPLEKQTFQNIAAFKKESLFFLREALQKVEGFQINRSSSKESKK